MTAHREAIAANTRISSARIDRNSSRDLFVSAYIVEPPDLALHTSLLNLLWYAVECINALPSISGNNARYGGHFIICVNKLEAISENELSSLDGRVRKQLSQFLEEAQAAVALLAGFLEKAAAEQAPDSLVIPITAGGDIAVKATYLQWLAVCISEELKLPFSDEEQRQG